MATNENTVDVQTLESNLTDMISREMGFDVKKVENRIQNTSLATMDNIITAGIQLAARSRNMSYRRDAASVTTISEHGEQVGITASFF